MVELPDRRLVDAIGCDRPIIQAPIGGDGSRRSFVTAIRQGEFELGPIGSGLAPPTCLALRAAEIVPQLAGDTLAILDHRS